MLFTAGLILNCILFGGLMRPLEVNSKNKDKVGCCHLPYLYKYVQENVSNEEKKMLSLPTNGTFENGAGSLKPVIIIFIQSMSC